MILFLGLLDQDSSGDLNLCELHIFELYSACTMNERRQAITADEACAASRSGPMGLADGLFVANNL